MTRTRCRRSAFSMIELLIILALLFLLAAFLLPAVQKVRSAAGRTQDQNNLKQLAIGFHAYHDVTKAFPFNGVKGSVADPTDRGSGSWAFSTLPYLEQERLYANPKAAEKTKIPLFLSPGRDRPGIVTEGKHKGPQTDYAINTWLNDPKKAALDAPNRKLSFLQITDGTSNTIMLGQLSLRIADYKKTDGGEGRETILVGGTMGTGRNEGKHLNDGPDIEFANRFGGPFPKLTNFAFCDGSVRAIATSVDVQPMLTPDGGEPIRPD